ncbi:SpoIID/LytB domain-containing protein [uncultured Robinsoniella sp.]|uniref:SpoIID/LytB domain-containing protein n=1 Tax=uncultured Robinsoniella sp. TaxID=904190 RepID=UPI00374F14C9
MKEKIKNILALILLVLLLPYVITVLMSGKIRQTYLDRGDDHSFISVEVDGKVREVNFEDYVMGVTALQIPSAYQTEAIKAQMVVARTNLCKMLEDHPTELLKDKYLTVDQMEELGIRDKFSRASRETSGQVLTYDGNLILASYHAISAGRTRDGNDVLGSQNYPYLASVQSAQDVEAERYLHAEVYDPDEILRICREQYPDMKAYYPEGTEVSTDIPADQPGDQGTDKSADQPTDQATDQPTDQPAESQGNDNSTGESTKPDPDKGADTTGQTEAGTGAKESRIDEDNQQETALNVKAEGRENVTTAWNADQGADALSDGLSGVETEILTEAAEPKAPKETQGQTESAAKPQAQSEGAAETQGQTESAAETQAQSEGVLESQAQPESSGNEQTGNDELNKNNLWDNMEIESNDDAGYITKIRIGDTEIPGEEFRKFLNLNSSCFTMEQVEKGIRITTKGLGHGVGMSQYGAERMAESGKPYDEILQYYFKNVTIEINEKQNTSETESNAVNS